MSIIVDKKRKKFNMPHMYIILLAIIFMMAILTHLIPAGSYDRIPGVDGRMVVVPSSFHLISQSPVGLLATLIAIPQGIVDAGWIFVLTLIIGGTITVVKKTGIIEVMVNKLANSLSDKGILIIFVLMPVFAMIDTFIGMPELCMIYIPIIAPLVRRLGFDSVTACAIALCGSAAGFISAITNPFTTGIGQKIAEIPLYTHTGYRIVVLSVMLIVGATYIARYATKVRKSPEFSLTYHEDLLLQKDSNSQSTTASTIQQITTATLRQKLAGLSTLVLFFALIFGVMKYQWDLPQMGGMFVAITIAAGFLGGLNGEEICNAFTEGCVDILMGALIVGISRGISVVMIQGQIMDSIVHSLAIMIQGFPPAITSIGMMIATTFFNFLIPSGSGKAVIIMPILAPLADVVGVSRHTALLAYQFGDGITNLFWPSVGWCIAAISLGNVPYIKWAKFMFPLVVIWTTVGGILVVISQYIGF